MPLNIERTKHVVTAAVHRPEARNAVNFELMDLLEDLLDELLKDSDIRLFVLTGTGSSFISGGDLREFHQIKSAAEAKKMTRRMLSLLEKIRSLPFWTLAALNGGTYGGGWEIAASFDFRIAKCGIKIGFTQGKFYLPPGWGGVASLTRLITKHQALFWLASQSIIDAKKALNAGFLNDVYNQNTYAEDLQELIRKLTLNDRPFIEYLKKSAHFEDSSQEVDPFSTFWESEIHHNRVQAFLDRDKG